MTKSYQLYKQELKAWTVVTTLDKTKWGHAIALTLPENDESGIRAKIFQSIGNELDGEAGYTNILKAMDEIYEQDANIDLCDKIRSFMNYKKEDKVTMQAYISGFETAYKLARGKGLPEIPDAYLKMSSSRTVTTG